MERALCQRDQRCVNEMEEGDGDGTWESMEYGYSRASSARTSHVLKPGDDMRWGRLGTGGWEEQGAGHRDIEPVMIGRLESCSPAPCSCGRTHHQTGIEREMGERAEGWEDRQSNGTEESQTARA